jgi:DNA polymerase
MIDKQTQLDQIATEIKNFKDLEIARKCTQSVPGEGNPDARIMFIGEAPGFNEDRQGRPFIGQAGKLLEKVIQENLGMQRQDVYITNIVKFRPPENRDPLPEEIEACKGWLDKQIQIIKPQIITTLGRYSMSKFIPNVTISRVHGQPRNVNFLDQKVIVFPMYHPAAALRAGDVMKEFINDFDKLKRLIQPVISSGESPLTQQSLF